MNIKLTDQNHKTRTGEPEETLWIPGQPVTAKGKHKTLCTSGFIHFYRSPEVAVLLNPIHAHFDNPVGWEFLSTGEEIHEPLKSGTRSGMVVRQISLPVYKSVQVVAFGILSALKVCNEHDFIVWANNWLTGKDRSDTSAHAFTAVYASASAYASACAALAAYDSAAYAAYAALAAAYASRKNEVIDFQALALQAFDY